jgi:hypothetical protein
VHSCMHLEINYLSGHLSAILLLTTWCKENINIHFMPIHFTTNILVFEAIKHTFMLYRPVTCEMFNKL